MCLWPSLASGRPISPTRWAAHYRRELGFKSAVTTRPGGLYPHHAANPHALPRVSLNGLFQSRRYVDVFASGAIFSAMGKLTG